MSGGTGPPATARPSAAADELAQVLRLLRPTVVRAALLSATGAGDRVPCHVLDAKYRPGQHCTVLYDVGGRLVRGDVALGQDGSGDGVPLLRTSVLPDDPELPGLRLVAGAEGARRVLATATGAADALRCRSRLLRYRPGRATLLLRGWVRDGACPSRRATCVVKVYDDPGKAAAVAAEADRLARVPQVQTGALRVPRVLASLPALPGVAWEVVDGVPLDVLLAAGSPVGVEGVRRAGAALAALHAATEVSGRARPVERQLEKYRRRAERVRVAAPALGARLCGVLDALAATAPVAGDTTEVLVHGDCKPAQFLLGPAGVTVLDLDSCGRADPASDLGAFSASLLQVGLRRRRGPVPVAPPAALAEQLVDGYLEAASWLDGDRRAVRVRLPWYEALALQRKAQRAFGRSPLSPLPAALLGAAEEALARLPGARR